MGTAFECAQSIPGRGAECERNSSQTFGLGLYRADIALHRAYRRAQGCSQPPAYGCQQQTRVGCLASWSAYKKVEYAQRCSCSAAVAGSHPRSPMCRHQIPHINDVPTAIGHSATVTDCTDLFWPLFVTYTQTDMSRVHRTKQVSRARGIGWHFFVAHQIAPGHIGRQRAVGRRYGQDLW